MPCRPGELLLDRRGDGLRGVLRRRAGIVRRDAHRRRRDLRIARDRQQLNREQAEQRDDDRDHRAEDRPPDEEVLDLVLSRPAVDRCRAHGLPAGFGAACCRRPAPASPRAPARPSAFRRRSTRSPADEPESMIQSVPLHGPVCTSRATTVSPGADDVHELPPESLHAPRAAERRAHSLRVKPSSRTRTNCPGSSRRSAFANFARNSCVPLAESSDGATKLSRPDARQQRAVGQHHAHRESCCPAGSARRRADRAATSRNCCDDGWNVT